MSKELFVSSTPHETRVGLVEDDQLAEIYLERENEYTLAGSIYKGRVTRVLPGMQSAFVDIGLERDAFLYVSDFMEVGDQDDTEEIPTSRNFVAVEAPGTAETTPEHRMVNAELENDEPEEGSSSAQDENQASAEGEDSSRRDSDGRGGRWRGRRRRRGRRGERLPEAKFTPAEPPPPPPVVEPEYGPPAGYQPILLPGESISKYKRADAKPPSAPPPSEFRSDPPAVDHNRWEHQAEPVQAAAPFVIEGGHWEEEQQAGSEPALGEEHETSATELDENVAARQDTASERERDHDDEQLDPQDLQQAEHEPDDAVETSEASPHRDGNMDFESESESDKVGHYRHQTDIVASNDRVMEEEEIDEDEADLAAYVEDLEEEATFDEMEEETRAAEDYHEALASVAIEAVAEQKNVPAREFGFEGGNGSSEEEEDEDDVDSDIEQAQSEAEALLAAEQVDNGTGEAHASVRGPSSNAGYTQRTQRGGRFDRRNRGRRGGTSGNSSGGRRFPRRNEVHSMPQISELLKEGQEILVQIAKEPIGKKGARITSHIALPGRFLVFMPTVNHTGVSRKIASEEERQRLKRIIMSERENGHGGFIVRTAAQGAAEEELRADIRFLKGLWAEIRNRADNGRSPALIYHDLNVVERVLRDQVTSDFSAIWVDTEQEYERILRFANRFQPALVRRVKLYTKETPLYDQFGLNEEINKALKSKVWLKSGGYIVINQTEALVAIDVNTGKYVGKTARLEDTIVKTNVDAIKEIVRQIRLRDLGGIIVIDFIDMDERRNRQKVMQALEEELRNDRAPSKVLQFNDFGLVAITRKRVKQSLERTLGAPCPYCTGTGFVKSVQSVCNEIYVEMRKLANHLDHADVMLRVNPEVAKGLKANNARALTEIEEMTRKTIIVKSDPALHQEQYDIT